MFKSPYIQINEHGIDLLKNYSVKTHINFIEIKSITVYKGSLLDNWAIVFVIGILISAVSLIWTYNSLESWDHVSKSTAPKSSLMILISPWLVLLSGVFLVFKSLRKSIKLKINTDKKIFRISIKEFEKQDKTNKLIVFLESRVSLKINI